MIVSRKCEAAHGFLFGSEREREREGRKSIAWDEWKWCGGCGPVSILHIRIYTIYRSLMGLLKKTVFR